MSEEVTSQAAAKKARRLKTHKKYSDDCAVCVCCIVSICRSLYYVFKATAEVRTNKNLYQHSCQTCANLNKEPSTDANNK